jgi:GxxExxY protein
MTDIELTEIIIGCAIDVHKALGPGLLESVYQECLYYKLTQEELFVEKEKPMPVVFEEVELDCGFRLDLLIERRIVIECKSVKALDDVHLAQILTYLKLGDFRTGLLINFNVTLLKNGIKRVKNGY